MSPADFILMLISHCLELGLVSILEPVSDEGREGRKEGRKEEREGGREGGRKGQREGGREEGRDREREGGRERGRKGKKNYHDWLCPVIPDVGLLLRKSETAY
jgi:hypothetical protein